MGPRPDERVEATPEQLAELEAAPPLTSTPEQRVLARAERDSVVRRLEESGAGGLEWETKLPDTRATWERAAKRAGIELGITELECFAAGCYLTTTTASETDASRLTQTLMNTPLASAWSGELYASGVSLTAEGKVETTWAFIGAGVPALASAIEVPGAT